MVRDYISEANDYFKNNDYSSAEVLLDKALEHCLWYLFLKFCFYFSRDPDLHRKRAKCRQSRGDIQNAIADIRAIAKLVPDSTEAYLEMSQMYYHVGDAENSLV